VNIKDGLTYVVNLLQKEQLKTISSHREVSETVYTSGIHVWNIAILEFQRLSWLKVGFIGIVNIFTPIDIPNHNR
jgi:hypothetical protein